MAAKRMSEGGISVIYRENALAKKAAAAGGIRRQSERKQQWRNATISKRWRRMLIWRVIAASAENSKIARKQHQAIHRRAAALCGGSSINERHQWRKRNGVAAAKRRVSSSIISEIAWRRRRGAAITAWRINAHQRRIRKRRIMQRIAASMKASAAMAW